MEAEVGDPIDDVEVADVLTATKKRGRDEPQPEQQPQSQADNQNYDDKKSRGNYRCSRCNVPKKGHICPFQPRFKRRDQAGDANNTEFVNDEAVQAEFDADMTVRALGELGKQGLPDSYFLTPASQQISLSGIDASLQGVVVGHHQQQQHH